MGKVLIEKLLRSCSKVHRIFVLLRSKRGKSIDARLEEIKNTAVSTELIKGLFKYKKDDNCIIQHLTMMNIALRCYKRTRQ